LEVDRSLFSNNIFMRTWLLDTTGATLYVDLVNTNEVAVATNLLGFNLLTGSGTSFVNDLSIPFSNYLDAVGIRLRRGTGEITVYDSALIINLATTNTNGQGGSESTNGTTTATISGSVSYAGTQPGSIRVFAVTNSGSWSSPWSTTISDPGAYSLTGLPTQVTYWVRAYVDANANGSNNTWEARGTGVPAPLVLSCNTNVDVALKDPDSNNDGLSDWAAMQLGFDPQYSNACARLPFVELFETNTVHVGDIHGQNGWVAGVTNTAFVQTNTIFAGQQALQLDGGSASTAAVYHIFASTNASVVWTDLRTIVRAANTNAIGVLATNSATAFFFNKDGRLVVLDGMQPVGQKWVTLTNVPPVTTGSWVRVTFAMDYTAQRWLICLNGTNVAANLGFGIPCSELHMLKIQGKKGYADNLTVSTSEPSDLSLDGDSLPDVWELQNFGSYDQTDSGDPDGDGFTNLQEYLFGTNPNNADTDGDGIPDGWEVSHGLNPFANDANLDPDNDTLSNLQEYQHGTDPQDANSDLFPDWSHRMRLSFRDTGLQQTLTNFPVLIVLNTNRVNYAEFLPNGADLLFHTPDGAVLAHEIEQWDTNGNSYVWVNVSQISTSASGNFIMMRWGNAAASNSAHPADVWNSDYVGVWHLADADNTVADSTRFAWNGVNYGADGVTGQVGRAHHFDGASHVTLPADSLRTIGNGVSVSLWLKGDNARCPIGIAFQASRNFGHVMTAEMLDRWGNVNWRSYTENNYCSKTPQANEYMNQWNHWLFVKNSAAGTMTIYLNGQTWATASGKTAAYEIADTFQLGSYWDGSIGYHGAIDEFRVAAKTLSASWAAAEYRAMNDALLIYGNREISVQAGQNGVEPSTNGTFVIHCNPAPTGLPLTVHYTLGGTARSGVEFSPMSGSVLIPACSSVVTTTVAVIQNNLSENNTRTLSLTLINGDYFISAASNSASIGIVGTSGGNSSLADSDGDGMPDSWETTYSFNPTNAADAVLDSDGDGVSNLNEYLHGLNPRVAVLDSDGDGLPDAEEISIFGTNPTLADTNADGTNDMTVVMSKTGVETSYRYGSWAETNGVLAALSNRGMRAEYQLTPPEAGMYRLVTRLKNVAPGSPAATFRLQVLMDQTPIRWLDIYVPAATNADAVMITPWLTATNHTLRFAWLDDGAANKFLGLVSLQLQQIHGSCTNATGHQDWMEAILEQGADTDGDGLSDYEEVNVWHTDPLNPDTDGDTLSDGDEVNVFQTDPLTASSDVTLTAEFDGTNTVARNYWAENSAWYEVGTTLVSPEHWGSAVYAYEVNLTNAGMQRLAMQIRAMSIRDTSNTYDLPDDYIFGVRVTIDGYYIGVMKMKADLDQSGTGYLTLPWLEAGTHRIEVQWQDWFSSWLYYLNGQGLRRTVLGIEKLHFYAVDGVDANTNNVPDWMERVVNPALDTDGDGLSDRDEMLLYHTNPLSKDTDHDGLFDKQELLYGTDPLNPDSDSDGVLDGEEVLELHTNPHQSEFDGTVTNCVFASGSATNAVGGNWVMDGSELLAQNRRGWVQYGLDAPQADIYRVCVQATHVVTISQCTPVEPVAESDIMIYVDGRYLGKKRLVAPQGIYGTVTMFTPYLPAGPHTVKLYWENVNSRIALKIKEVTLQQYGGADANSNGFKDWVETSLPGMNTLDAVHALPSTLPAGQTCVSPVCIEGAGPYADMMSVSVNGSTNLAAARSGILDRWYVDVPLSATGSTAIAVAFQAGALTRSTNLTWVPLNVLGAADLTVRQHDTLMLTAAPSGASNGTITIQVLQGATVLTNLQTTVTTPVTYTFASAGTYTVSGAWQSGGNSANDSLVVTVVGDSFSSASAACMIGSTRQWTCTNMPASAVLESDDSVSLLWTNQIAMLNMSAIEKAHYLVARAWQGGPILASSQLDGFWIQGAVDSYMWVVETYPDGSALWQTSLVAKNLPSTVAIDLKIIVGGVTFDDMSLERWLTSADL
ncbi:MAG: DUF2341 domain-containing protein, partial [Kiritimatiellia bacterium]